MDQNCISDKWILVNERLPDKHDEICFIANPQEKYIGIYSPSRNSFLWYDIVNDRYIKIPNVTHWLLLPKV